MTRIDVARELHGYRSELARLQDQTFALAHDLGDLVSVIDGARTEAQAYELVPRHLLADMEDLLRAVATGAAHESATSADVAVDRAGELLRTLYGAPLPNRQVAAMLDEVPRAPSIVDGEHLYDEMAPTGEVF